MEVNIIHLPHRADRLEFLQQELIAQSINEYNIWEGILDDDLPCRGISKSHKQVVQFAKDNKLPEILIAEDDFQFTSLGAFDFFLENKPTEFDIYLGGINHGALKNDNSVDAFLGTTFYLIDKRFYDVFLAIPEDRHLDRALKKKGKFVVCNPFTVIPRDGYSDNLKQFVTYEHCLQGRRLFGKENYKCEAV